MLSRVLLICGEGNSIITNRISRAHTWPILNWLDFCSKSLRLWEDSNLHAPCCGTWWLKRASNTDTWRSSSTMLAIGNSARCAHNLRFCCNTRAMSALGLLILIKSAYHEFLRLSAIRDEGCLVQLRENKQSGHRQGETAQKLPYKKTEVNTSSFFRSRNLVSKKKRKRKRGKRKKNCEAPGGQSGMLRSRSCWRSVICKPWFATIKKINWQQTARYSLVDPTIPTILQYVDIGSFSDVKRSRHDGSQNECGVGK